MGKMNELKTTHDIVMEVLKAQPMTRNSDNQLCYWVYKVVGKRNGIDIDSMSMPRFLLHMKEYNMPAFETIRRARQKIQAEHPELCGDKTVEGQRLLNEEVFREYARKSKII